MTGKLIVSDADVDAAVPVPADVDVTFAVVECLKFLFKTAHMPDSRTSEPANKRSGINSDILPRQKSVLRETNGLAWPSRTRSGTLSALGR